MKYLKPSDEGWIIGNGYRKQLLLNESDLNAKGTLVQIVEIEPKTSVPFHHHKKMTEVFHILEGQGEMTIAGQKYHLSVGDTLTTEPCESHNAINDTDSTFRYIVFKTNVEAEDSYWES